MESARSSSCPHIVLMFLNFFVLYKSHMCFYIDHEYGKMVFWQVIWKWYGVNIRATPGYSPFLLLQPHGYSSLSFTSSLFFHSCNSPIAIEIRQTTVEEELEPYSISLYLLECLYIKEMLIIFIFIFF